MLKIKIYDAFDFIPETNLTETYFYEHKGIYPVYSGQTEKNGIVAFIDEFNQSKPCVTFTTYGSAGKMFYRDGKYTIGRNCMGLQLKEECEDLINLEWFSYKFQNLFFKLRIGDKDGQKSLNKTLLKTVKIIIPSIPIQQKQLGLYKKNENIINKIDNLKNNLKLLLFSKLELNDSLYNEKIGTIFDIIGGNSGLVEEFIYNNQATIESDKIPILSGATSKSNSMGYVSRNVELAGKTLKIFSNESVLITRNGFYAGTMRYMNNVFTINDHAYVLIPKTDWKDKINLRWFVYQYQELFYNLVTSKSDNATFNKTYAERQKITIPDKEFQDRIAEKLLKTDYLIEELEKANEQIGKLLSCEIIG